VASKRGFENAVRELLTRDVPDVRLRTFEGPGASACDLAATEAIAKLILGSNLLNGHSDLLLLIIVDNTSEGGGNQASGMYQFTEWPFGDGSLAWHQPATHRMEDTGPQEAVGLLFGQREPQDATGGATQARHQQHLARSWSWYGLRFGKVRHPPYAPLEVLFFSGRSRKHFGNRTYGD
jgi:hypothetical protein